MEVPKSNVIMHLNSEFNNKFESWKTSWPGIFD